MKLNPFQSYHLRGIAKALPVLLDNSHEKHMVLGRDILAWGTITEIDGEQIDPDKRYLWHYPVQMYRNHYRRLKKAYQKEEMAGVYKYLAEVDRFVRLSKQQGALSAYLALQEFLNVDQRQTA